MLTRTDLEAREAQTLAPYATLSRGARREFPEPESQTRTAFQKDRDRVLHTTAFRRLEAKTQVFLNAQDDHYRTRLTHTLEVQQVARSVALSLGLNETLAETLALAHDLGHPPFGHAGETVLDTLMKDHGGFDHNGQSRRIVTVLENRYAEFPGLNLTLDVIDGLNKHGRAGLLRPSLEAQLVDVADAIAYTAHDLDDGLRSGLLTPEHLAQLPLWQALLERTGIRPSPLTALERRILHRELLGWLIGDLTANSERQLRAQGITTPEQAMHAPQRLIGLSEELAKGLRDTSTFMRVNVYHHWRVARQVEQARRTLDTLFETFVRSPTLLPERPRARLESSTDLHRVVCDHIAGMTDRYALDTYASLTPPTASWMGGRQN